MRAKKVTGTSNLNRLVIGLDYGTTYTGVSFCEASSDGKHAEQIEIVHDWPSQGTKIATKEKVPSEISYQDDGIMWGSQIPSESFRHMWTKLLLDSERRNGASKAFQEMIASLQNSNKDPVEVIANFLREVRLHLIKNLDQRYGAALWRSMPITLVVTVPAVWSDPAKSRTLKAVQEAGFSSFEFPKLEKTLVATEPECAALYTIKSMHGTNQDTKFAIGDGFVVCDMGGGTVDLISYKVAGLNPTAVEEATEGDGDKCGGSFVDRAFLRWLERRIGTTDFIKISGCRSEEIPHTSLSRKAALMLQDFILQAKSGFSGTETYFLRLPHPLSAIEDDETRGIVDGEILITSDDMKEMFDRSIGSTFKLLNLQVQRARKSGVAMKYVFMVGGFSESPYVFNVIKDFASTLDLVAIKPSYAWSAVARGAAAKGLEDGKASAVLKRKCRRHYGHPIVECFDERKHDPADAFWCPYSGVKLASHQVEWLLSKGQDLCTSELSHAYMDMEVRFWPGEFRQSSLSLCAADTDAAPTRSDDPDVYTVATVNVDLSRVPARYFEPRHHPNGRLYHELSYQVEISLQSSLEYYLTVDGERYGSLTATYK